ncbi:PAS domain-containing sensor histidine kinase [Pelobium sp.]|nr:PAS domain-containing sensor histidine kinase [Pelobium sp.]MDA9554865.1 PAS domain-containing sensor histidine kinase [Pelobium sp.]
MQKDDEFSISKLRYEELLQLENFYEFSQDLLCIASFEGYFKRINPTVCRVLGYTEEELKGRKIMDFVHPDDRDATINHRLGIISGISPTNFENRYLTKSGEVVWLSWTSIPDNNSNSVFAIAKVVTNRKKQEEERNLLLENITSVNQELKLFTRISAHDLRSPVNNILSIIKLLDISKINDSENLELINLLKLTTEQLHQTLETYINELIRKDEANREPKALLNLEEVLNQVLQSIKELIKQSGVILETDFSAFKQINFSKMFLESILLNLITNSIKYANPNRQLFIKIYTQIVNDKYQLVIVDNGLGFDYEKIKDRMFGLNEIFHNHIDSKGIGLYLVQTHVNAMGGKIEAFGEVDKGARFTITFKKENFWSPDFQHQNS